MIRLVTVVGARPQFIKAAVVSREIRRTGGLVEDLVHTGQHYDDDMSAVFFKELDIPAPAVNLEVGSAPHGVQTGRMLAAVEAVLLERQPTAVLVYGDTNSTLAGALAAAKLRLPVIHVEAGLRSFNRGMPEEVNRIVADHLSDVLFPPTAVAAERLRAEGLGDRVIEQVGDVMYDATLHARERLAGPPGPLPPGVAPGEYVLATIHRAENTDDPARLAAIFRGLEQVALTRPVLFPVHPRTLSQASRLGVALPAAEGLHRLPPQGYLALQGLEAGAAVIVTDSGGVQKEAYWHGVPCVTLRGETEWTELVHAGWNRLVIPGGPDAIAAAITAAAAETRGPRPAFFGEGDAGRRIVARLLATYG